MTTTLTCAAFILRRYGMIRMEACICMTTTGLHLWVFEVKILGPHVVRSPNKETEEATICCHTARKHTIPSVASTVQKVQKSESHYTFGVKQTHHHDSRFHWWKLHHSEMEWPRRKEGTIKRRLPTPPRN